MSGHSKWSQIKRQKGATDVKRGAIFTKMTREVMLAAKEGGSDPEANFRLRLAMDRARGVNMPLANIQRAIDRATGAAGGELIESVLYEGYGPGGVSILVEAATDNRNRTASEVRAAFTKHNGSLGGPGSVAWQFENKGVIEIAAADLDPDEVSLQAIDAGADDVEADADSITIYTSPALLRQVKDALEKAGLKIESAELSMKPTGTVTLDADRATKVLRLVDALDDLDDVTKVHANFDVPAEILANV
ncbi:MAG: YebC/PmpR family DNA-binding transcriptional regulator [Chloroflexi bacterium]|nr:YebC/PmpR family DNA-binding transcriptional regulator [Chloroflexota bacterium]